MPPPTDSTTWRLGNDSRPPFHKSTFVAIFLNSSQRVDHGVYWREEGTISKLYRIDEDEENQARAEPKLARKKQNKWPGYSGKISIFGKCEATLDITCFPPEPLRAPSADPSTLSEPLRLGKSFSDNASSDLLLRAR